MRAICRKLRKNQTDAEKLLWSRLRNRLFLGLKFRRQHEVGKFVADFCCPDVKLILEIDGGQHAENRLADQKRTKALEMCGYRVLRFWNHEVLGNLDVVMEKIQMSLNTPHPGPLPGGARELLQPSSSRREGDMFHSPSLRREGKTLRTSSSRRKKGMARGPLSESTPHPSPLPGGARELLQSPSRDSTGKTIYKPSSRGEGKTLRTPSPDRTGKTLYKSSSRGEGKILRTPSPFQGEGWGEGQ